MLGRRLDDLLIDGPAKAGAFFHRCPSAQLINDDQGGLAKMKEVSCISTMKVDDWLTRCSHY